MRYIKLFLLTILLLILWSPAVRSAQAAYYPPCGDLQPPDSSSICRPMFMLGQEIQVKPEIPFVWLRSAAGSPIIMATVWPGSGPTMKIINTSDYWDGYQRWWYVSLYPVNQHIAGWVEQSSLRAYGALPTNDPTIQANWITPLAAWVKPGVPFLWMRSTPASANNITGTIPANGQVKVLGSPSYDSVQWWWFVEYKAGRNYYYGYVEQGLLVAPA